MINGYMYILECADGSLYTGSTQNLKKRLREHHNGQGAIHTRKHRPVKLLYYETFMFIHEAYLREKQIQGWSRKKKLALINQKHQELPAMVGEIIGVLNNQIVRPSKTPIFLLLLFLLTLGCNRPDTISYPYSQWTVAPSGHNIQWYYETDLEMNSSFIAIPGEEGWEEWYTDLLEYRASVREKIGKAPPAMKATPGSGESVRIHFDKTGYDLHLQEGESITFHGRIRDLKLPVTIFADYDLKTKGEELSYVVRKKITGADSLTVRPEAGDVTFSMATRIPHFASDSFSITPAIRIKLQTDQEQPSFIIDSVVLEVPATDQRTAYHSAIKKMIAAQSEDNDLKLPGEFDWTHDNFVMGFAFVWDQDLWDPETGSWTVDHYCEKMEKEFGGFQSVVLWHSYPNIGIDEKNQFDLFEALPGGLFGLKEIVDAFHENGVKVFLTYNPWDLDTRRSGQSDNRELARIVDQCGFDGIYLDTWKSSTGVISIFSQDEFMREAVQDVAGKNIAFSTEIHPEYKDLVGKNALTSSWGQEIQPIHYTDLSVVKWIMPEHKQHYIRRMNKERRQELAHAWINGQGIQVWENIFGTMNPWNAADRQRLRRMNTIWQSFGRMYISDNWKPCIPTGSDSLLYSEWSAGNDRIVNLVNTSAAPTNMTYRFEPQQGTRYFDLWNGQELKPDEESGQINVMVKDFGCLLVTPEPGDEVQRIMEKQQLENQKELPKKENDPHMMEQSIKEPLDFPYPRPGIRMNNDQQLMEVKGGRHTLEANHIWREGHCYPDAGASDNHDLDLRREDGVLTIHHEYTARFDNYGIMPRVVTNGEYEKFLRESGYSPRFKANFLKHWNGGNCPAELKNDPVVYVSLNDARAYAVWADMQLPDEWQWQLAGEQLGDDFRFNEVFEWNESERSDGNNRFVTLRGGCETWILPSSWWYLPSAPYGEKAGGAQLLDAHVKYFLMYPGLDRASTIGFRCIRKKER